MNGSDILIEGNTVYNSDDCLAINNPAKNIHFRNNHCNGGHGVSIAFQGNSVVGDIQNVMYVIHVVVGSGD